MASTIMQEWAEVKNETCKPAEIIRQARGKAERALLEVCVSEISRICDAFAYDTGLCIEVVSFHVREVGRLGERKSTVISDVSVHHEEA